MATPLHVPRAAKGPLARLGGPLVLAHLQANLAVPQGPLLVLVPLLVVPLRHLGAKRGASVLGVLLGLWTEGLNIGAMAPLKEKWSHFDLKSWVTDGTKIRPGIPSSWRIPIWVKLTRNFEAILLYYSPIKYSESRSEFYFCQWLNFLGQNNSIFSCSAKWPYRSLDTQTFLLHFFLNISFNSESSFLYLKKLKEMEPN